MDGRVSYDGTIDESRSQSEGESESGGGSRSFGTVTSQRRRRSRNSDNSNRDRRGSYSRRRRRDDDYSSKNHSCHDAFESSDGDSFLTSLSSRRELAKEFRFASHDRTERRRRGDYAQGRSSDGEYTIERRSRRGSRDYSDGERGEDDEGFMEEGTTYSTMSEEQSARTGCDRCDGQRRRPRSGGRRDEDGESCLESYLRTHGRSRRPSGDDFERCASTRFSYGRIGRMARPRPGRRKYCSNSVDDEPMGDSTSDVENGKLARYRGEDLDEFDGSGSESDDSESSKQQQQQPPASSHFKRELRVWYRRRIAPYRKIMIAQLLCCAYILVLTFSPPPVGLADPATGDVVDATSPQNTKDGVVRMNGNYRPIVATGPFQKFCLAISRMSAFSMYPVLVAVFVTKMKATMAFLNGTPVSMCLGLVREGHDFHVMAGTYIAFDVWVHATFHVLRWASQRNVDLLWTTAPGTTGLIAALATPLVTFPMMYLKSKLSYEIRKGLHVAFFYVLAAALCLHVPPSAMPNGGFLAPVLGFCVVLYTLDAAYAYLFMTEMIETTSFHVLSSGVRTTMPVSGRFRGSRAGRAGYAYINIPWVDDRQWHPFSLFENPEDPAMQQMFLMRNGDWTDAVHAALARDTTRPCWIKGPFPSPYSHASLYDNQILVASGIGITPALAAINAFKSSRRINLIWAVRDPEILEFFIEHLYLDHDGWNLIFYTGEAPLLSSVESEFVERKGANIRVRKGRPQLRDLIPNIVYGCESESSTFSLWEDSKEQKGFVRELDDHAMLTWGIMYCGGSKGVLSALRGVSIDYNIDLHIDSFAW